VLVDEFQDTNAIQYGFVRLLAGETGQVFVVGDDDQAIYGWRGAKVENVQRSCATTPVRVTLRWNRTTGPAPTSSMPPTR
jgi:DNA helicase-2/ATP-dependent DNA helicase PcrA